MAISSAQAIISSILNYLFSSFSIGLMNILNKAGLLIIDPCMTSYWFLFFYYQHLILFLNKAFSGILPHLNLRYNLLAN